MLITLTAGLKVEPYRQPYFSGIWNDNLAEYIQVCE